MPSSSPASEQAPDSGDAEYPHGTHPGLVPGVAVDEQRVRYRTDKAGIIHCTIGKADFESDKLKQNLEALLLDLIKAKPATAKGTYLQKISISSTMGPGVSLDLTSATQA